MIYLQLGECCAAQAAMTDGVSNGRLLLPGTTRTLHEADVSTRCSR